MIVAIWFTCVYVKNSKKLFVSKGDNLGEMTVVSVVPFNFQEYSDHSSEIESNNAKLILKGLIVITGRFYLLESEIGFTGYCMSEFDEVSLTRLPYLPVNNRRPADSFCFRNEDFVQNVLGKGDKIVTVKIDNYELNSYPAEVMDWADLVEVITIK